MNKIEIGSKVVGVYSGDVGKVTGINPNADPKGVRGKMAWCVLWEAGGDACKEFWMVESDLLLLSEYDVEEFPQHNLPVGE